MRDVLTASLQTLGYALVTGAAVWILLQGPV
jgi:hypothetical protein